LDEDSLVHRLQAQGHGNNHSRVEIDYTNDMMMLVTKVGQYDQFGILLENNEQGEELMFAIRLWLEERKKNGSG
jgi:hypothetical protein